jgi:hypothetical protein
MDSIQASRYIEILGEIIDSIEDFEQETEDREFNEDTINQQAKEIDRLQYENTTLKCQLIEIRTQLDLARAAAPKEIVCTNMHL